MLHLPESAFWKSTPRKIIMLWNEYLRLSGHTDGQEAPRGENIVYRDGKPYKVKTAGEIGNIF